ncbi:MAG: SRPBCC domain-containing protein [Bacteroidota bacterium]
MIFIVAALVGLTLALIILIRVLPVKIQYLETIKVNTPVNLVYDAIRYQERLMEWSAWPKETKSLCAVKNTDGQVGAQTIYMNKKGKEFGYQEITELIPNEKVSFYLKSYVAPFEKEVRLYFLLKSMDEETTEVTLWFDETLKKPHFLIAYFGGIPKWVHQMHLKDLAGLKQYAENSSFVV